MIIAQHGFLTNNVMDWIKTGKGLENEESMFYDIFDDQFWDHDNLKKSGFEFENLKETFKKLDDLKIPFFLTGSMFFNQIDIITGMRRYNDFDFFTEHNEGVMLLLNRLGYRIIGQRTRSGYQDVGTVEVMRLGKIDIQLVRNAPKKLIAQNLIYHTLNMDGGITKDQAGKIWTIALNALDLANPSAIQTSYYAYMRKHDKWLNNRGMRHDFSEKLVAAMNLKK